MTISSHAEVSEAVIMAKLGEGIWGEGIILVHGALHRRYSWEFENREYTILIALDRKEYAKALTSERPRGYYYNYLPPLVEEGTEGLNQMVREFLRVIPRNWNAERRVNFVFSFVQVLHYRKDQATGYDDYHKYAIETLVEREGDCEDTSILLASILRGMGFEVALICPPEHAAVGVKGNFAGDFYSYDGSNYYYCETAWDPHHGNYYTVGKLPRKYAKKEAIVIPINRRPFRPKRLLPNVTLPKPEPPPPLSSRERLKRGIELYYKARYNEAISMLRSALNELRRGEDQIEAYLYLGFSKNGIGESEESTISEFEKAVRLFPNVELPYKHPKFVPMLKLARSKVAGKLNIIVSPARASIMIDGIELKKKRQGFASTWLPKGTHTVKGSYRKYSKTATVRMNPGDNETIHLEILPIFEHHLPRNVFVSQAPHLALTVISVNIPKQVEVHYKLPDHHGNMLEQSRRKMTRTKNQPTPDKRKYHVNLPPPAHTGKIKYFIKVDGSRIPEHGYHEISVIIPDPPMIRIPQPNPNAAITYKHPINIIAKVSSSVSINEVRVHYDPLKARLSERSPFQVLNYSSPGKYQGIIPAGDNEKGETIWYFVAASNAGGESKTPYRRVDINPRPPIIVSVEPPHKTKFRLSEPITIIAKVASSVPIDKVCVYHGSSEAGLTDNSPFQVLYDQSSQGKYEGRIPAGDNEKGGATWYLVTASNAGGETKSDPKSVIVIAPPKPVILEPPDEAQFKLNQPIYIIAKATSRVSIHEVRVYYRSDSAQPYENSQLEHLSSTGTYVGEIPKEHNKREEFVSYFVKATDALGQDARTPDKSLSINLNERVWASHSWSNDVSKNGSLNSHWERGNVFSIAYLSEGKDSQTLGAQLDVAYENPENTSAIVQWGPRIKESNVSFALHGGITGYRRFDGGSSLAMYSNQITPVLGGSLKFYPLDGVAIDVTGLMRLRSASSADDKDSGILKDYLHHYGLGIRLYMNRTWNFTAGYGRWRVGDHENASAQIGLGFTF